MKYEQIIAAGLRDLASAKNFQNLFSNAEHVVVQAKRQLDEEDWSIVSEWISRAKLHERYIIWLVVAIEVSTNGIVSTIEVPRVYFVEAEYVDNHQHNCQIGQFEDGDWQALVDLGGDFAAMDIELTADEPVEHFIKFWEATRPAPNAPIAPDAISLIAPIRFMSGG